jgi:signal transduction histidine kinase
MFSLVAGATAAIVILVLFLIKWNRILEKRVKRRTRELELSNNELELANEQLKKINEDLKKHDDLQKQFINMAAHELRTPSQAIIGFAELLSKSSKRNRDYEATLLRNANRLHKLSTDMLDAARIEAGTLKIDKSEFDLNEKIKNVITDVKKASEKAINDNHMQIIFQPKESIIVNADKAKIFQVISNLLNNAIKFSDHGTVVLTAHKNEETRNAVVTITDSGKGIDAKLLPDLFLRFRAKSETGTGLGLFISKKIIEAHGGEITGYNNPIGKGATFTFTLPLSNESQ